MNKFGRVVLSAVLTSAMIVTPVMATPTIDELEKEKQAAESEVDSLQEQLTQIVGKISQLEDDISVKGEEILQAEEDLADAEELERIQYGDMKLRIQFMYEQGDGGVLETIMSAESFTDLVNKAEYVSSVHSYDRKKLDEYIATKQQIEELKAALEEEHASMQAMQADFEAEKENLNEMIASKQSEIADLGEQLQAALVAAMKKKQEEEAAAAAAAAASADQSAGTGNTGASAGSSVSAGGSTGGTAPNYDGAVGGSSVSRAYGALGAAYVSGASGPNAFDCSGFVSYCLTGKYNRIGTSGSFGSLPRVDDPQPGDIVCYAGHVGIYVGGGQMIHASTSGTGVIQSSIESSVSSNGPYWFTRY